jgi:hypothetical protein
MGGSRADRDQRQNDEQAEQETHREIIRAPPKSAVKSG